MDGSGAAADPFVQVAVVFVEDGAPRHLSRPHELGALGAGDTALFGGKLPDTKHVTFTNVCEIGYVLDKHTGKLLVFSCIDNLTKGASGQAIQCMNIRFGLDESTGLL